MSTVRTKSLIFMSSSFRAIALMTLSESACFAPPQPTHAHFLRMYSRQIDNPLFPALRSGPTAGSGAYPKSKFLAAVGRDQYDGRSDLKLPIE